MNPLIAIDYAGLATITIQPWRIDLQWHNRNPIRCKTATVAEMESIFLLMFERRLPKGGKEYRVPGTDYSGFLPYLARFAIQA